MSKLTTKMTEVLLYVAATPEQREALAHPGRATNTCAALVKRGLITPGMNLRDHELTDLGREILAEASHLILHVEPADKFAPHATATLPAESERRAARIANVLSDWKGKEIVLPSGRIATVGEHRHGTVRLIRTTGPNAGDSAWYPAEKIWQGLEDGTILTPDQLTAEAERREAVAMLDAMLTHPTRTPESIAYVARAALRILAEANGADSLSGLALAELDRRHPARPVTVKRHSTGEVWHLVNRYGHVVEAGEYTGVSGRRFRISDMPLTTMRPATGEPLEVRVEYTETDNAPALDTWAQLRVLVDGWHWERVAA